MIELSEAIQCRPDADSPAVYVVTNLVGSGAHREEEIVGGLHWHTDIEFEPIPLSTSMFYVQSVPSTRNGVDGTWVNDQPREEGFITGLISRVDGAKEQTATQW